MRLEDMTEEVDLEQVSGLRFWLSQIAKDPVLIEIARKGLEDELVELRDHMIGLMGPGNGLVIRERDGEHSSVIRITTADAVILALQFIANADRAEITRLRAEVAQTRRGY